MNAELLVIVSDLHNGSVVGLAPPETVTESGNTVSFGGNLLQAWLWDCWLMTVARAKEIIDTAEAVLLVNGDATEGHHHGNSEELIAAAIETHTDMSVQCLRPFLSLCKQRLVVKGTECHTCNMENRLAEKIEAETSKA